MNASAASISETAMNSHLPHALVMENNPALAGRIERMLNREGFDIDIADTNKGVRKALKRRRFDLFVADLQLLDTHGVKTLSRLREDKPQTKIIVFSAKETMPTADTALTQGVHDFMHRRRRGVSAQPIVQSHAMPVDVGLPLLNPIPHVAETVDQRERIIQVLDRTLHDRAFWVDLMEKGTAALAGYGLSGEAKAAIASGDLLWVKTHVGDLPEERLAFLYKRLEREAW